MFFKKKRQELTNNLLGVGDTLIRLQEEINTKQESISDLRKRMDQEKLK